MALHGPTPNTDREYLVEIYTALRDLRDKFGSLPCQTHNSRLTALEHWQGKVMAGLSLLAFVTGVLGAVVVNQLLHLIP